MPKNHIELIYTKREELKISETEIAAIRKRSSGGRGRTTFFWNNWTFMEYSNAALSISATRLSTIYCCLNHQMVNRNEVFFMKTFKSSTTNVFDCENKNKNEDLIWWSFHRIPFSTCDDSQMEFFHFLLKSTHANAITHMLHVCLRNECASQRIIIIWTLYQQHPSIAGWRVRESIKNIPMSEFEYNRICNKIIYANSLCGIASPFVQSC